MRITRPAACIVILAALVLGIVAPSVFADSHEILRGEHGPRASAVAWDYAPPSLGIWKGHIVNQGLRSLVVDVYDNTSGSMDLISHQRIRFDALGAYPTGSVYTDQLWVSPTHTYTIVATPSGPRGSSCVLDDVFWAPPPPVPVFSYAVDHMTVSVSADGSYDPDGSVVLFEWSFGDGKAAIGMTAVHTYLFPGNFVITLTLTDNDGLTTQIRETVQIVDEKPVPSFTYSASGRTVEADASASVDDYGIANYTWYWGDGTYGYGMIATHTYAPAYVPAAAIEGPPFPFYVVGYAYDANGTPLPGCTVTVKNMRSGDIFTTMTELDGLYLVEIGTSTPSGIVSGDLINVTAQLDGLQGWNEGVVSLESAFLWLDITLVEHAGGPAYTVTLTVTDTIGQSASKSMEISLPDQLVAAFTCVVDRMTVDVDASASTAPDGIVSYGWDWGDGTAPDLLTVSTATHVYGAPQGTVPAPPPGDIPPWPPFYIAGYTYDAEGLPLLSCAVTITNRATGEYLATESDGTQGFYVVDAGYLPWQDDVIEVTAVKGLAFGSGWAVFDHNTQSFLRIDVRLAPPGERLVTLTITDSNGWTSSASKTVDIGVPPPVATYAKSTITGGVKVSVVSITRTDVPWDDILIRLGDGTNFALWAPASADLDGGMVATYAYPAKTLGVLTVHCAVTDIGGNGLVNGGDFFALTTYEGDPSFSPATVYQAVLVYEPTGESIGTGIAFTG